MRLALRRRTDTALPGVIGVARVDRRAEALLPRLRRGDIAVLDQVDLDRATADALVAAEVVGVVNASPCISGRYPTLGPEILVNAGVPVIDAVGTDVFREVKDGTRVRLHEQLLYPADSEDPLAEGRPQTMETSGRMCVESTTVWSPPRPRISSRVSMICLGSSPAVGSSRMRTSGLLRMAWARPTRWR